MLKPVEHPIMQHLNAIALSGCALFFVGCLLLIAGIIQATGWL